MQNKTIKIIQVHAWYENQRPPFPWCWDSTTFKHKTAGSVQNTEELTMVSK